MGHSIEISREEDVPAPIRKGLWIVVRFAAGMNALATAWTFLLMLFITADVCGRVFFNHPLTGAPELVQVSLVALVFLHIPHTLWVGRHIRSEVLVSKMGTRLRALLFALTYILGACMFAGILISSWGHMMEAWKTGVYTGEGSLRVPLAPVRTIVILGSAVTAFFYLVRVFESLRIVADSWKGRNNWIR